MGNDLTYFIRQAGVVVSLFCLSLTTSCGSGDPVVARVDDSELKESEMIILMEHLGYDPEKKKDKERFLENWTELEALRLEMQENYPEKAELVRLRAQSFSGELARYYLLEARILKQLDTTITENQLQDYYALHKGDFILQDYLVKALYIKIPKGAKAEQPLKEHFLLKNDKDLVKVNSYAKLYAENYYFDDEHWIYFSELTKDIPLKTWNRDNLVLNRTKTYFSDDDFTYFVNIIDFKLKDSAPPFEFVREQLREIILQKRMNALREGQEKSLIQHVKKKHEIDTHI